MKLPSAKISVIVITLMIILTPAHFSLVSAQSSDDDTSTSSQAGILPGTTRTDCDTLLSQTQEKKANATDSNNSQEFTEYFLQNKGDILACAIKTGRVEIWMAPFYITYVVEFILAIAGSVCILFITLGGYYYIFGGVSDQVDKGKNTIKYAIAGFVVVLVAWMLVNFVQVLLTST